MSKNQWSQLSKGENNLLLLRASVLATGARNILGFRICKGLPTTFRERSDLAIVELRTEVATFRVNFHVVGVIYDRKEQYIRLDQGRVRLEGLIFCRVKERSLDSLY